MIYLNSLIADHLYLRVGYTDREKHESYPSEEKFDTVICLNIVEHLEIGIGLPPDIRNALEDNGRAVVFSPYGPKFFGTLDVVFGHYRPYTKEPFTEVASWAGLQLEALLSFNGVGSPAWWLNARLLRRKTFGLWQIKMLDLLTPLFGVIDKYLLLPHFSIIAILKKPSLESVHDATDSPRPEWLLHGAAM